LIANLSKLIVITNLELFLKKKNIYQGFEFLILTFFITGGIYSLLCVEASVQRGLGLNYTIIIAMGQNLF
jgi:hypothetical protein